MSDKKKAAWFMLASVWFNWLSWALVIVVPLYAAASGNPLNPWLLLIAAWLALVSHRLLTWGFKQIPDGEEKTWIKDALDSI